MLWYCAREGHPRPGRAARAKGSLQSWTAACVDPLAWHVAGCLGVVSAEWMANTQSSTGQLWSPFALPPPAPRHAVCSHREGGECWAWAW